MPRGSPKTPMCVRVDKDVLEQVRTRMKDPVHGGTKYASMTDLVERLFLDWLITQNRKAKDLPNDK